MKTLLPIIISILYAGLALELLLIATLATAAPSASGAIWPTVVQEARP